MAVVYVSSTYKDLHRERDAVYRAMRRLRHDVIAMEDYVATDRRPLDKCLADVARSEVYLGIFGWRYGYRPPGQERSITELEFREAVRLGKKCLGFLKEQSPKRPSADQVDRERIEKLRTELSRDYLVSFFSSPDDLAAKVTASVANLFGELSEALGKLDVPLGRVVEMLKRIGKTPKLSLSQVDEEVDHLQRDAMNWVSDARFPRTAELRLAEARRLIADATERYPRNEALLVSRGYVEKTAGQVCELRSDHDGKNEAYGKAARYFRAALELNPSDVGALNGQANMFYENGDYGKAAVLGRIITSYRPDYAAAYWDLGMALEQLADRAKPDVELLEELADVFDTLVVLIPNEPSGFTPADLEDARAKARRYRQLAKRRSGTRRRTRALPSTKTAST